MWQLTGGRMFLLSTLLVLGAATSVQSNRNRASNNDNYETNDQANNDYDNNQQPQQQAKPFESGQQYIYAYDGQIATGLDSNGVDQGQPQQKAVSRIQTMAHITFRSGNQATLRLQQTRIGQLNKHIEQPEQVQPMRMFEGKKVHEEQANQLALPIQFDYNQGLVSNVKFHEDDRAWSRNLKRSVLNLLQLNIKDQSQRQQQSWESQDNNWDEQTKTFAVQETTIEGDCQTVYTINKNKNGQSQEVQSSEEQGNQKNRQSQSNSFNVTKTINFKQCQKIADIAHGYQTEQEQQECAKCQLQWYKQLAESRQESNQQQQQSAQAQPCDQCDPKEIKEQRLDRSTILRFTVNGQPQQFAIQRAELVSQYVYKSMKSQNSPYSASLQAIASAQLVFRRAQQPKEENEQQQKQLQRLRSNNQNDNDQNDNTLLYDNEWDRDEKRFYMEGDDEFGRNSPFASVQNKVENAQQIIRKLVTAASDKQNGVEFEQLMQLQRLVEVLRMCSVAELKKIESMVSSDATTSLLRSGEERRKAQQIIADAMAMAGTRNTIFFLAQQITNGNLDTTQALQSLKSLTGLVAPSDQQVDIVLSLCQSQSLQNDGPLKQTCWLTFGSMVNELCQKEQRKTQQTGNNQDQEQGQQQQRQAFGAQTGFQPLKQVCQAQKKESYKQALVEQFARAETTYDKLLALKALGNAGIDSSVFDIERVVKDKREDRAVRCQAIDSLRRLRTQMPRKIQRCLLPIFQNTKEQPVVRMAAFNLIMHTHPEPAILDHLTYTLIKESSPEVQAFVYSGMKTLSKSKVPSEKQIANHLKNALKLVNIDEQYLRQSRKYQLPIYSNEQQEGAFLNLMTIFNGRNTLPNYMAASLDSLLNDQYERAQIRVSFTQKDIEQWYEQLTKALSTITDSNQRNQQRGGSQSDRQQMRSDRRSSSGLSGFGRYNDPEERMSKIHNDLSIRPRRQSNNKRQNNAQMDNNDEEQQDQLANNEQAFAMICVRIGDVDQAIIPLDHKTAPRPLKRLLNGQQLSLRELLQSFNKNFRILTAMNLHEKTAKIPTSVGLPLRVQQSTPLMIAIDGEMKTNTEGQQSGLKANLNLQPSVCVAHVQKMECWMPIMITGAVTTQAIEMSAPIEAEISSEQQNGGIQMKLKTPQMPKTRLFGLHSLPSTYTADWDTRFKMQREPKVRAIHNVQLEQLQQEVDKKYGEHTMGMPVRVNGHYHMPANIDDYQQTIQLLMATENHLHITFEPADATPKEVVLRADASAFTKTSGQEHEPELNQFYDNENSQFEDSIHPEDNFEDMQLDNQEQRRNKLSSFLGNYKPGQMYQHKLTLSAETRGGRKECRAELQVKGACDAAFKFCKASVNVERSALLADESNQWTMRSKVQVLCPDAVKNVEELEQLEGQSKNAKFILKAEAEWGSDQKQQVKVSVNGEKAQSQQHRNRINDDFHGSSQRYQKKQAAFINKFDVVADYQLRKSSQNTANRALEMLKTYNFWNTQAHSKSNGRENQMRATIVIDPIGQQYANISVKTPSESVRVQSVRLPMTIRPFPLVRRADKPTHSVRQFISRVTRSEDQVRAECTIDDKRVTTFDGSSYDAPLGTCYSVVAKDCRSTKPRFVVMMKAVEGEGDRNQKVTVLNKDQAIECQPMKSTNGQKTKLQCKINGEEVVDNNGDYDSSNQQNANSNNQNTNGDKLVEYNDAEQTEAVIRVDGVTVKLECWCKDCKCQKATIKLSQTYKQGQCGLCGHYDDNSDNDLQMGNGDQTEDLAAFHRSYSFVDDDCTDANRQHFYENKKSSFKRLGNKRQLRQRKHVMDSEEQQDEEWRAGNYASDDDNNDSSSEEVRNKAGRSNINKYRQQQNNKQQRKPSRRNEKDPIEQTKVIEFNHKVCFSKQPVKQCPEGTADPDEEQNGQQTPVKSQQQQQQQNKVTFVCVPRSSAEARRMQRQANKGQIVEVPDRGASFIESIKQPTRCVVY